MAARMASGARLEQDIFSGGNPLRACVTWSRVRDFASSIDFPITISVALELQAMAAPHPNVFCLISAMHFHDIAAGGIADHPDSISIFYLTRIAGIFEVFQDGGVVHSVRLLQVFGLCKLL
jgi:hypothetical protein